MKENIDWDNKGQVLEKVKEDSNNFKKASDRLRGDIDVIKVVYDNHNGWDMELMRKFDEHSKGFIHELIREAIIHGWNCGFDGINPVSGWND